jgi:oxygen-independent coproporphyrinogen-3 oxidase
VDQYISTLKKEMDMVAREIPRKRVPVIACYIGGGTPTCLSGKQLADILDHCYRRFFISSHAEISIEANPGTIDEEKLRSLMRAGVNRLGFGVQSLDNNVLKMLGCGHTAKQAIYALKEARETGFTNIGIDLLYRVPGQTASDWNRDLKRALDLKLPHITTPELFIDRGTALFKEQQKGRVPPQPDEKKTIGMYRETCKLLTGAGYRHYNLEYDFALPGKECLYHRVNREAPQGEVLGFGPGAYSYFNGAVYNNLPDLERYTKETDAGRLPIQYGKKLSPREKMARYLVHGVYFVKVEKKSFAERFGVDMESVYGDVLERLEERRWIRRDDAEISLTPEGKLYVNNVSKEFYAGKDGGQS